MSAKDFLKAAEDAEKLGNMFSGIVAIGPKLRELGSLEQAVDDAKARVERANADGRKRIDELAAVEADLTEKVRVLKGNIANRTEDLRQAQDKVRQEKAKAEVEARAIKDAAAVEASSIMFAAANEAARVKAEANAVMMAAHDNLGAKAIEYQKIETEIAQAAAERDAIKAEIEALRERLKV